MKLVIGGPPCRTVSRLRNKGPPGPRRVRGRGLERFGLANLSSEEMELVDGDAALFLKQAALWRRAEEVRRQRAGGVGALRESPKIQRPIWMNQKLHTMHFFLHLSGADVLGGFGGDVLHTV